MDLDCVEQEGFFLVWVLALFFVAEIVYAL